MGGGYPQPIAPDGTFCANAKPLSTSEVIVLGSNDSGLFEGVITTTSGEAGFECAGDDDCTDVGVISTTQISTSCVTGTVVGDVGDLTDRKVSYDATYGSSGASMYGSLDLADDDTFCAQLPTSVTFLSFDVSSRGTDEIVITDTGSSSFMSCSGSAAASAEGGTLPTLVEATCGDEACFDLGDLEVECVETSIGVDVGDLFGGDTGFGGLTDF
jgi:hypothetical protein